MQATHKNDLNFAAFALSILKLVTPEQAFDALESGSLGKHVKLTDSDYEDILRMRDQGIAWLEIANMYGLSSNSSLHHRVRRYKERRQDQC